MTPNFIRAALDSEFGAGGAGLRGNKGVQGATPSTPLSRGLGWTGNSQGCRGLVAWPHAFPRRPPQRAPPARRGKARHPSPTARHQVCTEAPPKKVSYRASTRPPARGENRPDSSRSFPLIVPVLRPQVRVTPASQRPRSSRALRRRDGPARGKRRSAELRG